VAGGDVGVACRLGGRGVARYEQVVRLADERKAAVLGDDGPVDTGELAQRRGVGQCLPRGDDDRPTPLAQRRERAGVDDQLTVGQRPVDVDDQRRIGAHVRLPPRSGARRPAGRA
jgi:hypothetical protein